jgi:hypothetical protein
MPVRFNPSATRLCPIQPVEQEPEPDQPARTKEVHPAQPVGRRVYVQPCSNLGLDARARVQPNPPVTLRLITYLSIFCLKERAMN